MKKILSMFLALPLLAAVSFAFVGCSKDDPIKEEEEKETPTLSISTKTYEVSGAGEKVNIAVKTNQTLSVSTTESWIHAQVTDVKTVSLTIDASEEYEQRTADVTIKGGILSETVKIVQKGSQILTLDKAEHTVPGDGGTITIETKSNFEYEIVMPNVYWIKQSETRGVTTTRVSFDVLVNDASSSREATILFRDTKSSLEKSLKIIQEEGIFVSFEDDNFKAYMLENHDKNKDGRISSKEAEAITFISVNNKKITSLKGIEACVNLTYLHCGDNKLESLDISGCTELTSLYCYGNRLTSLNVSGCIKLTDLNCEQNQLESLDVNSCTELTKLSCNSNKLKTLDVSGCVKLTNLYCSNTQMEALDVSGCTELTSLSCYGNRLTSLNVSSCVELKQLFCDSNQLESLDISGCTALVTLSCGFNMLTALDVSGYTELESLNCWHNILASLNVSGCVKLTELNCAMNQLTYLNVSGCTAMATLSCHSNQLTSLDVSTCTALYDLWCSGNQLTSLDVSKCTALVKLLCYGNQLTSLDASNCSKLSELSCGSGSNSKLTTLVLPAGRTFKTLDYPNGTEVTYK